MWCCLDVLAAYSSRSRLEQYLAAYEGRYRAAVPEFDLWDDISKDWGLEHDRMTEEPLDKYQVFGSLIARTRFETPRNSNQRWLVPVQGA